MRLAREVLDQSVIVVKQCSGEGDSHFNTEHCKAKMVISLFHSNIAQFIEACSKPLEVVIEYECFNFITFSLNDQITNLCLHTLGCIKGQSEALKHFLLMFLKAAKDIVVGLLSFNQMLCIMA